MCRKHAYLVCVKTISGRNQGFLIECTIIAYQAMSHGIYNHVFSRYGAGDRECNVSRLSK